MKGAWVAILALFCLATGCFDTSSPGPSQKFGALYDGEVGGNTNTNCTAILPTPIYQNETWSPLNLSTPVGTTMKIVWTPYGKAAQLNGIRRVAMGGAAETASPTPANLSLQAGNWSHDPGSTLDTGSFWIYSKGCAGLQIALSWQYDGIPKSERVDIQGIVGVGWQPVSATRSILS